jgi:hypothetical protein
MASPLCRIHVFSLFFSIDAEFHHWSYISPIDGQINIVMEY